MSLNFKKATEFERYNSSIDKGDHIPRLRYFDNYEITIGPFFNDDTKLIKFKSDHNDLERHAREHFGDEIARVNKPLPSTNIIVTLKSGKKYVVRKSRLILGGS